MGFGPQTGKPPHVIWVCFLNPKAIIRSDAEQPDGGTDYDRELDPVRENQLVREWQERMGPGYQIVVAQLSKFKLTGGLGISLEGTVEKVDGEEQNPHHYIRSVLPNGPVGQNGRLQSGDELLEVNGRKLLGLYHTDVVGILKVGEAFVEEVRVAGIKLSCYRSFR